MNRRPHLLLNTTRRAYVWAGPQRATLDSLSTDRFSPISALIYLLGTAWNGDRVALVSEVMSRDDVAAAVWEDLGEAKDRGAIWRDDSLLDDATQYVAEARQRALTLNTETHKDRAPRIIVNYDKRQRLDPGEFGDGPSLLRIACGALSGVPGGTQTALTMLLAGSSHGRATRGDFPTHSDLVGSWAGCRIGVVPVTSSEVPVGTESITDELVHVLEAAHLGGYSLDPHGEVERTWASERSKKKYLKKFRGRARHGLR